jgi:hypothetical protein
MVITPLSADLHDLLLHSRLFQKDSKHIKEFLMQYVKIQHRIFVSIQVFNRAAPIYAPSLRKTIREFCCWLLLTGA